MKQNTLCQTETTETTCSQVILDWRPMLEDSLTVLQTILIMYEDFD